MKKLKVLIVDDDFMIARMHGKFVEQQEGYQAVGIANNFEQALTLARDLQPDLILLDVYLPDRSGIEVLRTVRGERIPCDIILITAAREVDIIEDAFRLGIFDYLIKPFDLELLRGALGKYRQFKSHLNQAVQPDQRFVEGLKNLRTAQPINLPQTQKGIDVRTLELVRQSLLQENALRTADQVAQAAGVSRSTARAYLDHLLEKGEIEELLHYGTVGRPQRQFRIKAGS
jgi:response regulator of citrate/malate metabolism